MTTKCHLYHWLITVYVVTFFCYIQRYHSFTTSYAGLWCCYVDHFCIDDSACTERQSASHCMLPCYTDVRVLALTCESHALLGWYGVETPRTGVPEPGAFSAYFVFVLLTYMISSTFDSRCSERLLDCNVESPKPEVNELSVKGIDCQEGRMSV